jgi:hypothetical protein
MSTLNARANQAYQALVAELEAEDQVLEFSTTQGAFEEGWETGYKAADQEWRTPSALEIEAAAHALFADNEVGEWEDGNLDTLLRYRRAAKIVLESYTAVQWVLS